MGNIDLFYFTHTKITGCLPLLPLTLKYGDITIVVGGNMSYIVNGQKVNVGANDAIVFKKGDVRARDAGTSEVEYYSFNYTYDLLPELGGYITNCITPEMRDLLFLYEKSFYSYSLCSNEKELYYFKNLYLSLYEIAKDTPVNARIESIKRFITAQINTPVTLGDISRHIFLSPNHCNFIFKKQTGLTITEYIIREKMDMAKKMILSKSIPLSEISVRLGYSDYSYFSKLFKKCYGESPVCYKKSHC